MILVDLSHTLNSNMPVYPGTERPEFKDICTIVSDGFAEKLITMYSHTGTHIDAPAHMISGTNTLDKYDINHFAGSAFVINCTNIQDGIITKEFLVQSNIDFFKYDFIILHTGWSKYWGEDKYFETIPILSKDAAQFLSEFNLNGIGLDTISIDSVPSDDYYNHYTVLGKNMIIIENLTNLELVSGKEINFFCLPLKIQNADGSPTRAVAVIKYGGLYEN